MDLEDVAIDDIEPLIAALEGALAKRDVGRIIIENAPYADLKLSRRQARQLVQALQRRFDAAVH